MPRAGSERAITLVATAVTCLATGISSLAYGILGQPASAGSGVQLVDGGFDFAPAQAGQAYGFQRLSDPDRTVMTDADGKVLAVMTDGARTVHLVGPPRVFAEPRFTDATVTTEFWVRLAPREWRAGAESEDWFVEWVDQALRDRSPDVLAVAMEYTYGAPPRTDGDGMQFAGDASFGPLSPDDPDGRAENSDFYDYLGVPWQFPDGIRERPDPAHVRSLDCSGFLRMVYGYRLGYPLLGGNEPGPGLPRRAYAMAASGPGVQLMPNTGKRPRDLDMLLPGDLLFLNAGPTTGAHIEHSGIYLGVDDRGHLRFVSSRSQANGPTMGDLAGESILDGTGYWATRLRTARRI
jgi:cell wall-associated NlpC family hydrolase